MNEIDVITEAFPHTPEGQPLCGHCRGHRPGYLMLCVTCWERLSPFVKIEIVRARSRGEKARILLATRTQLP